MNRKPCIIVHGGACTLSDLVVPRYKEGTRRAALIGYTTLTKGGTSVDAVEAAVKCLEDDSTFNAGHGSVLTEIGTIEMDAIIAVGDKMETGGVSCVRDIANPITLARKVMEDTPHCLLCGEGAMKFAMKLNFPILPVNELITSDSVNKSFDVSKGMSEADIQIYKDRIRNAKSTKDLETFRTELVNQKIPFKEIGHDTVGAVAIDNLGRIACATSTGGVPGKMLGRVGDSPIFGCGAYANPYGACSSTGRGEALIRGTICRDAIQYIEQGYSAQEAAQMSLDIVLERTGGRGGIILIDKAGDIGCAFNTNSMAWVSITPDEKRYGVKADENEKFEY